MTESLGEIKAALEEVSACLHSAYRCAQLAEQRLTEAVALLTELNQSHHDSLVPPELPKAGQELTRGLGLIIGGVDSVAAIEARL
ncbi:MAG TPA: hypothetical protein VNP03_23635 [Pseudonocardia sp.]|nr:hypothetical protein [Pseudonocardia sp.]